MARAQVVRAEVDERRYDLRTDLGRAELLAQLTTRVEAAA
jgi:hypothetical protein